MYVHSICIQLKKLNVSCFLMNYKKRFLNFFSPFRKLAFNALKKSKLYPNITFLTTGSVYSLSMIDLGLFFLSKNRYQKFLVA